MDNTTPTNINWLKILVTEPRNFMIIVCIVAVSIIYTDFKSLVTEQRYTYQTMAQGFTNEIKAIREDMVIIARDLDDIKNIMDKTDNNDK